MDGSESSEISDTVKDQHRELVETVHNKNKQLSDLLHDIEVSFYSFKISEILW